MNYEERLEDIRMHPEKHRHTFDELMACSTVGNTLVSRLMVTHQIHARLGTNGGIRCDVVKGACACGAWH